MVIGPYSIPSTLASVTLRLSSGQHIWGSNVSRTPAMQHIKTFFPFFDVFL